MIRKFIKDIVEENNGFHYDQPHRLGEESLSVIVPVIREVNWKRNYITLAEAKNVIIEDTGRIDLVNVKNNEDMPLYINRGAIFSGGTQERAVIHGHIVKPNSSLNVAVRCIHQTKGISASTIMKYDGCVPYTIDLTKQLKTWESINVYTTNCSGDNLTINTDITLGNISHNVFTDYSPINYEVTYASTTGDFTIDCDNNNMQIPHLTDKSNTYRQDDLVGALDDMSNKIKDAMKNIPYIENQVGGVFIEGTGKITGLDIYDIPKSWQSIKNDIIRKEGASFIDDDDDLFVMRPEKASKNISKKLDAEFIEKVIYSSDYSVIEIRYEELIGEAVVFENRVIHLTLWNKE